jgi:hypothetical protein
MSRRVKTLPEQYKPRLTQFMSFKDARNYDNDHQFSTEELASVTPQQIVRYMKLKVYGTPDPPRDSNPTKGRSSSLYYIKKAISFFMPNRLMDYNELSNPPVGNPTKSVAVNDFIKFVKRKEVRKQGRPSQARKPFEAPEYEKLIEILEDLDDEESRCFASAIYRFQVAMVGRIDDCSKSESLNLKRNFQHSDYSIFTQMCWSKNVHEERDAPDQILLGASDPRYCVLLGLATWMEHSLEKNGKGIFLFNYKGHICPIRIKEAADSKLKMVIHDPDFGVVELTIGKKGTHSIRKFATTFARRNGCSKDDVDLRARWKGGNKRMQDGYASVTLPFPDAKVAAALCKGGPIHYSVKANSGISKEWIFEHVVPNIFANYDEHVAIVLGRALLWRIFDSEQSKVVPRFISEKVKAAYNDLGSRNSLELGENPVKKQPLAVMGNDAEVHIELLLSPDDNADAQATNGIRSRRVRGHVEDRQIQYMNSLLMHLRQDNAEIRTELARNYQIQNTVLRVLNRNLRQLMRNPLLSHRQERSRNDNNELQHEMQHEMQQTNSNNATLSNMPRTLHELWNEYEFGLGERKPAKHFTLKERGKCRYTYHRRKVVWDQVADMVRRGWDAPDACNKLYDVYGHRSSITSIINEMRKHRRNGGHPSLHDTRI